MIDVTKKPKNHSVVIKLALHKNRAGKNPVNDTMSCLISLMNDSLTLLQGNFFQVHRFLALATKENLWFEFSLATGPLCLAKIFLKPIIEFFIVLSFLKLGARPQMIMAIILVTNNYFALQCFIKWLLLQLSLQAMFLLFTAAGRWDYNGSILSSY